MIKKCSFFTLVSICCVMASTTFAKELIINKKMSTTLKKFNPQFVAWETQDYTPTVQKDAVGKKRHPYALNLDVNGDKKSDLILNGHDDQHNILLCLLSNPKGYDVVVIREHDLMEPKEIENWNDGEKEIGLNYYLWPHKKGTGFTLAYPQQIDSEGNLLKDGAMIDYIFKDGKFHEIYQIL